MRRGGPLLALAAALFAAPPADAAETTLVYVTDNGADTIHVINGVTRAEIGVIGGVPKPYGLAFSADAARVYVASQGQNILYILDQPSGDPFLRVRLSGTPADLAVARGGEEVFVGIVSEPGGIDVVGAGLVGRMATIPLGAAIDSMTASADGAFVVAGSSSGRFLSIVDAKARKEVRRVAFDRPVRQAAIESRPDRSPGRIFVQLADFNGFAVVDFDSGTELKRIEFAAGSAARGAGGAAGGIAIAPDGKTLWAGSAASGSLYAFTLPELKPAGEVRLKGAAPALPEALAFSPTGTLYVADATANALAVVEAGASTEGGRTPVGPLPKRVRVMVLPYDLESELQEDERNAPPR
ncbi:MAG: hypothetical protein U1E56_07285 [Bauldia sp.]